MPNRILIIEDDEQLATAYAEFLTEHGYEVDCASELEQAQTLLAYMPYSVVITDLRLTKLGFGGLDLIRYVHERELDTRIIVFTGYSWPELKAEACGQGVDAFLRKPAPLQDLAKVVRHYLAGANL